MLTTEELRQIVETDHVQCGDAAAMARELLANREAQPVVVGKRALFTCSCCGAEGLDEPLESKCHCMGDGAYWVESALYLAPPAPAPAVVTPELTRVPELPPIDYEQELIFFSGRGASLRV